LLGILCVQILKNQVSFGDIALVTKAWSSVKGGTTMKLAATMIATLFGVTFATGAIAQPYPNRPITWVVQYTPGGLADIGARTVGKVLGEKLGVTIIIDNRPGAGAIIGAEAVAHARPDGYTLFYGSSGPMGVNVSLYKKLSYDPLKSFVAVHGIAISPVIVGTNPSKPYKTFKELVEYARQNPGKLNFSSVGIGSTQHLGGELLQLNTGIKLTHIPYKGSAPALADVLAGTIDVMIDNAIPVKPQIDAGKLLPLAVFAKQRLPILPDVPTTAELGFPDVVMSSWSSAALPAGTPQPIVDRLAQGFDEALRDPVLVKYYEDNGSIVMADYSKEKLTEFYVAEIAKFKKVIERSGATAE
jgi:tripartite-type tricarboxylate transporter receptor subunit TctC